MLDVLAFLSERVIPISQYDASFSGAYDTTKLKVEKFDLEYETKFVLSNDDIIFFCKI